MEDVDRIRQLYQETGSRRKVADIMGISRNTCKWSLHFDPLLTKKVTLN